ncbi:UNVERIFIED_CONTAM: hypothetical protein RMT77_002369 [Armadillidium vulgare]
MVAYELSLLVKAASKPNLVNIVKRTSEMIMDNKGYIEKIEFLGTKPLPLKIDAHGRTHNRASYFLIHYHTSYENFNKIQDNCKRDIDIIRPVIYPKPIPSEITCTLHEEIKPPAYRADVALMIKEGEERLPFTVKLKRKRDAALKNYLFN